MGKLGKNLFAVLGSVVILIIVGLVFPSLREAIWAVLVFLWQFIKAFFLESFAGKVIIMIVVALIGSGLCWSQREQRKIIAALTLIFEFIMGILFIVA